MIEWIKLHNFIWCEFAIDCRAGAGRIWKTWSSHARKLTIECSSEAMHLGSGARLNPEPEINHIYFSKYPRIYLSLSIPCPTPHKPASHSFCTHRFLLYMLHPFVHIYDVRFSAFLWKNKNRNRCRLLSTYYDGIYIQKR